MNKKYINIYDFTCFADILFYIYTAKGSYDFYQIAYSENYKHINNFAHIIENDIRSLIVSKKIIDIICKHAFGSEFTLADLYVISAFHKYDYEINHTVLQQANIVLIFEIIGYFDDSFVELAVNNLEYKDDKISAVTELFSKNNKRYFLIKVPISWSPMYGKTNKICNASPFYMSHWNMNTFNCLRGMSDAYQKHLFGRLLKIIYKEEYKSFAYFVITASEAK